MNSISIKYNLLKLFFMLSILLGITIALTYFTTQLISDTSKPESIILITCSIVFGLATAITLLHTLYHIIKHKSPLIVNSEGFHNYSSMTDSGNMQGAIIGFVGFMPWSHVRGIYILSELVSYRHFQTRKKFINVRLSAIPKDLPKGQQRLINTNHSLIKIGFNIKKEKPEDIFHIMNDAYNKYKESKSE